MARTLFWVTWLFFYMLFRVPVYLRVKSLKKQGRQQEAETIIAAHVDGWVSKLFRHIRVNLIVEGRENLPEEGETVVFVSNHQSFLDIPTFLYALDKPHALVAKKELTKAPFIYQWMKALDCIFVERSDIRAAAAAMRDAEELLGRGQSLVVCPEGTRSKTGEVGEFKAGAMRMALRSGDRIVPLCIEGSGRVLEENGYRLRPGDMYFKILPPVETKGLTREEQKALPRKLEEMVRAAREESHQRLVAGLKAKGLPEE